MFVVYNDGRDTLNAGTASSILNRSFIVKITRQFRF